MIENSSRGEAEAAEGSRQKAHYSMDEFCEWTSSLLYGTEICLNLSIYHLSICLSIYHLSMSIIYPLSILTMYSCSHTSLFFLFYLFFHLILFFETEPCIVDCPESCYVARLTPNSQIWSQPPEVLGLQDVAMVQLFVKFCKEGLRCKNNSQKGYTQICVLFTGESLKHILSRFH
jgi:hypothetical protein